MPADIQTILLIFGIAFLILFFTRRAIRRGKARAAAPVKPVQARPAGEKPQMTEEQFKRVWKNLSYLMLLAGAGNLYVAYMAVGQALKAASTVEMVILYGDALFAVAAAVVSVLVFRSHTKKLVYIYLILTVIPIMFFMSTGHYTDALVHLFPLILVYLVVQPVWSYIKE